MHHNKTSRRTSKTVHAATLSGISQVFKRKMPTEKEVGRSDAQLTFDSIPEKGPQKVPLKPGLCPDFDDCT